MNIIPYDWRPHQLWYRFKCRFFKKYSTVKSRYLPYTWVDRDTLLAHTMFEILSDYVEKEININDWEWDEEHRQAKTELDYLYDWWHEIYNKQYPNESEKLWEEQEKYYPDKILEPCPDSNRITKVFQWNDTEKEKKYRELAKQARELEQQIEKDLVTNLHRIIDIKRYLWS